MQLDGIDHSSHSHQVTQCMHEHTHYRKDNAAAAASGARSQATQLQMAEIQQEAQFSLSAWLQKTLRSGKRLWKGIWGNNETAAGAQTGDKTGAAQTMAQLAEDSAAGETAQAVNAASQAANAASQAANAASQAANAAAWGKQTVNPYFRTVEQQVLLQSAPVHRLRNRIREVAGQLADHLPGRFFGSRMKNPFREKQQRPREDLRKRSKYRKDELEIDCILTDESYLMDSYDRKGEYSRLTTKK